MGIVFIVKSISIFSFCETLIRSAYVRLAECMQKVIRLV